jgi:hypothetical protein
MLFRPTFETDETLAAEERIAQVVKAHSFSHIIGVMLHKLGRLQIIDFAVEIGIRPNQEIIAFLECKWRVETATQKGLPYGYGDGYYISLNKALHADSLNRAGTPVLLCCQFIDQSIWIAEDWTPDSLPGQRIIMAGRDDRNDGDDIEPHVVVPWANFTKIWGGVEDAQIEVLTAGLF